MALFSRIATRSFSTARSCRNSTPAATVIQPALPAPIVVKRPIGGFRGGLVGFFLGLSLAGGYGYLHLFEEYQSASNLLLVSVEELKQLTSKMSSHVRRIESVESELKSLQDHSASQTDVSSTRSELRKLVDGLRIEHLDLKAHVWGVEQEIKSQSGDSTTIRLH